MFYFWFRGAKDASALNLPAVNNYTAVITGVTDSGLINGVFNKSFTRVAN